MKVVKKRIHSGIWEGLVETDPARGGQEPPLLVMHLERQVQSVSLTRDPLVPNQWHLRIAIPPELLSDGVQVFVIVDRDSGETLEQFSIVTGAPLDEDTRAEVALLRAELDLLKRAFRRHCAETG